MAGESATCDADCTAAAGEECDDGNDVNTDSCVDRCRVAACGDGYVRDGLEDCDDGNAMTEACPYGTACAVCSSVCSIVTVIGPYCGDGIVSAGEACDDGDALACGTCSADCRRENVPAAASGTIDVVPASGLRNDGDVLVLSDGSNAVTFEYDKDDDCCGTTGRVPIIVAAGSSGETVALATANAVNVQPALLVTATASGSRVTLVNDAIGAHGNVPMLELVMDPGFVASGMSGGSEAAAACPPGVE